ncbi:uncharacterized protein LOC115888374 isoform X2 [Sitophilus oryzae]|uniref:Uncharacterized protein LOC115888374 isoform X2 n=1 Tax=Sitophilus oryzae TaxID=7048 RepID=A0A6J2YKN5_SITOR|nr:uncharacterized protein LOC115888374 isoform X2 [Sitophilus oryzae]
MTLNHKPENNCCKYKVNVLQLFALVVFIADLAFGFHILGTTMYFRYFLPRYLQASQLNAMIFIVASIMKEITDRFELLNGLLGQMKQERLNVIEGPDSARRNNKDDVYSNISNPDEDRENDCTNCPCEKLYQLRKAHIFLCNKVDEYNALFGTVLLFLLFVITVVWLDCTVFFASIHILRANAARFHFDQGHGMLYFILIGIFWIVGALIQAFALASTGEKLLNESSNTSKTCADILANIRPVKTPDLDRCFRRELEMLF